MTKILSQLLVTPEVEFRQGVSLLERASGSPGHDIRLTTEVQAACRAKIAELGLDPRDTAPAELYNALLLKLEASDQSLARVVDLESASQDFLAGLVQLVQKLAKGNTFALKTSSFKKILKANPPKKAQRFLSYRSFDSMLKREPIESILVATKYVESDGWQKSLTAKFENLKPSDFEFRKVRVSLLDSKVWRGKSANLVAKLNGNLLGLKEIGAVVALPLPEMRRGLLTAQFLLIAGLVNDCLAAGSYLKLNRVNANFGAAFAETISGEIEHDSPVVGQKLNWRTFHDFLAGSESQKPFNSELLGESSQLISPADELASLSPDLEFWRGSSRLATVLDGEIVSLNPLDVSLSLLNGVAFDNRIAHHYKAHLWRSFWQHYLQAETLAQKLADGWQRGLRGSGDDLALAPVLDEDFDA